MTVRQSVPASLLEATSCSAPSRGSSVPPTFVGRSHSLWRSSPCTGSALTYRPPSSTSPTCRPASGSRAGTEGLLSLVNLFSGGALLQLSIFALGVMPYITATIIVQLLRVVIPHFETLYKEGQSGQARLTQYTRYLTIALALLQSTTLVTVARSGQLFGTTGVPECQQLLTNDVWWAQLLMIITMTAGTGLIMWFAELVTERGIGNGMSILIFTSIAAAFPASMWAICAVEGLRGLPPRPRGRHRRGRTRRLRRAVAAPSPRRLRRRRRASRCSTPSAWSVAARTAARTRTSRSR